MYKKPTKKQLLIRRILLSSLATLSVIIIATVSILLMLGFQLNSTDGTLEQGALLQFDSKPNGADVYVDGVNINARTASKKAVISGTHTVLMAKTGYQDWTRTLTLDAGTLTWLDYTRLVPKERPIEKVATYATLTTTLFSPDYKWVLVQGDASVPRFQLVDLRSQTIKQTQVELPSTSYSEPTTEGVTHSFNLVSWDSEGRYVLVKHTYGEKTDWLVLDTQNVAQTVNVTQLLGADFKDIQFASTNGKTLYGLTTDGTIRKLDLSAATISRAFVTRAVSFSMYYDDKVLGYIGETANDATKLVAGIYKDGDESGHVLRTATNKDAALKIAVSSYHDNKYVAIAEDNVVTVLKGSYPSSTDDDASSLSKFATFELSGAVSNVSISPEGAFVVAQSGESYKSYEIEHERAAVGMISVAAGQVAPTLQWLDVAHLWNIQGSTLMMRDFDGSNVYEIMTVEPGFSASLSQNGRYFYAVGKDDKGYHLQRVKMILD